MVRTWADGKGICVLIRENHWLDPMNPSYMARSRQEIIASSCFTATLGVIVDVLACTC